MNEDWALLKGVRIRESTRAKRVVLKVHSDGLCEVVVPIKKRVGIKAIAKFVNTHRGWIERQKQRLQKKRVTVISPLKDQEKEVAQNTRDIVLPILKNLAELHGLKFNEVKFRVYSSRWGSCSADAKLQFHAHLSVLPIALVKYVIAHELAHTVHHHHQETFWRLVSEIDPEYLSHRRELRRFSCS